MKKGSAYLFFFFLFFSLLSCEGRRGQVSHSRINTPPSIFSVKIQPDQPDQGDELTLSIQSKDPDRDPIYYRYQWFKNDREILGENKGFLKSGLFKKEDRIQARVTPSDGKEEGAPVLSPPLQILNAPPEIESISIEPKNPGVQESLKASVKGFDPDGDFIYFNFQWEINGKTLPEEKGPVLEKGRFKKGDSIAVTVIPDDRSTSGTPKKSSSVSILNSPPIITSSPPVSIEGTAYSYQVKVDNPDGDPISFLLKTGPKGMTIQRETGLVQWEVREEDKGRSHSVEIEAGDLEGAKSFQRYTFTLHDK